MNIKINDQWQIRSDPYNYILCEMGVGKRNGATQAVSKREHFFPTLGQAFNYLVEKQVLTSDTEDWVSVMDLIENTRHDIMGAIQARGAENCAVA